MNNNKVSLKLQQEEKIAIFQDIRDLIKSNQSPNDISKSVILCIEEILQEKEDILNGKIGPNLKGTFRRSE